MVDRRLYPCNGRVAHDSLKGQLEGVTFLPGTLKNIAKPVVGLFARPGGSMDRQLMFGAAFLELDQDTNSGFSFGRAVSDGYVGYVATSSLEPATTATHKVTSLNTHIYPEANMKAVPLMALPMGAQLDLVSIGDRFAELRKGGYIPVQAIGVINVYAADHVAVAEQFLGTAYLWGGDSYHGLDCSGLVQTALQACGRPCPRDSDMQQNEVGVAFGGNSALQRGDLIFWKDHVGIMTDRTTIMHANAYHMRVTTEPLAEVAKRILKIEGHDITYRRRL